MDVLEKINNRYAFLLKERFYKTEYQQFKKLLFDYKNRDKEKIFAQPLKPYFITFKQRDKFSRITEVFLSVFEKLTNAYYDNNHVKSALLIDGRVRDFIGINPGYSGRQLVVRLDAYYNVSTDLLYLLEINFDDPSGMGESDLLLKLYNQLPSMEVLRNEYKISMDILVDALYKMLLNKYEEYCLNFGKQEQINPHIAVVCSRNSSIRLDVEFIIKFLKEKRLHVSYADPRDFVYDGKVLKLNGEEVHIVYRDNIKDFFRTESTGKAHSKIRNRILNYSKEACLHNRYINHYFKRGYFGHTEDILQAYSDNNICIINPFSSNICAQKSTFALIQDKLFSYLFNEEELDMIKKYVPWTRILGLYNTYYDKREINLASFVKLNRKKFVLKPNKGFGGEGILIGSEIGQVEWEEKIDLIIKSGLDYVVQEYINIPTENFPIYSKETLKGFSEQYVNINFWGIDGKFAGGFVRASEKKVINVHQGGKYVPIYNILN
jgi:hypothetical protein